MFTFTDETEFSYDDLAQFFNDNAVIEDINTPLMFYILPSLNIIHDSLSCDGTFDISNLDFQLLNRWAGYTGYMSNLVEEINQDNLANYHAYLHFCENILMQLTTPTTSF